MEISSLLDIEGIIKDPLGLEVSSAGIDRYLTSLEDLINIKTVTKVKSENYTERGKLIRHGPSYLTLSRLFYVLDVKIDLEGMSLKL